MSGFHREIQAFDLATVFLPLLSPADTGPAIIAVDCVKNEHLKAIMFARLCEEMSEAYFIFLP